MKALEGLGDSAVDDTVRDTLLEALQRDANPGGRVEAVNRVVRSVGSEGPAEPAVPGTPAEIAGSPVPTDPPVSRVIRPLEELQRSVPIPYVRRRSAAALR